jgi:hypothetical protein
VSAGPSLLVPCVLVLGGRYSAGGREGTSDSTGATANQIGDREQLRPANSLIGVPAISAMLSLLEALHSTCNLGRLTNKQVARQPPHPCHVTGVFLVAGLWEVETHWFHGRRSTLEVHSKKGCGKPGHQPCRWPTKASFWGAGIDTCPL